MTQVESSRSYFEHKYFEYISNKPVAAFIFKDKESDEVNYSIIVRSVKYNTEKIAVSLGGYAIKLLGIDSLHHW